MQKLMNNYLALAELDSELLNELNVDVRSIREAFELKIKSLKAVYWKELFDNLDTITSRLTTDSRDTMLAVLHANMHVDFTAENAHSIAIWAVKNANAYIDSQLVSIMERMTEQSNVRLYKSNYRTFGKEEWRYCRKPEGLGHYKLDYRIVVESLGGLQCTQFERIDNGLSSRATNFINDLRAIALSLGFDTKGQVGAEVVQWDTHVKHEFLFRDQETGQLEVLFDAKAFKKGTVHLRLNQNFICKLNCEFGRLKGWIKDIYHAADELEIPLELAQLGFNSQQKITASSFLQLGFDKAA
jgi:hypothetical protein